MNEEEKDDHGVKERVDDMTYRVFTIKDCPEKTYKRFIAWCEANSKNQTYVIYHLGLKMLLDAVETNAKDIMLLEKIQELDDRLTALEEKEVEPVKERKGPATFGRRDEDGQV